MEKFVNKILTFSTSQEVVIPKMLQLLHDISIYKYFTFFATVWDLQLFQDMTADDYKQPGNSDYLRKTIYKLFQQIENDNLEIGSKVTKFNATLWNTIEFVAKLMDCTFGYHPEFGGLAIWSKQLYNVFAYCPDNEESANFIKRYYIELMPDENINVTQQQCADINITIKIVKYYHEYYHKYTVTELVINTFEHYLKLSKVFIIKSIEITTENEWRQE